MGGKQKRARSQLVVSLGQGDEGASFRTAIDAAAREAKLPVTVWARRLLIEAAGAGWASSEPPSRREFSELVQRVAELEGMEAVHRGLMESRAERRARELRERKAATKARLVEPARARCGARSSRGTRAMRPDRSWQSRRSCRVSDAGAEGSAGQELGGVEGDVERLEQ